MMRAVWVGLLCAGCAAQPEPLRLERLGAPDAPTLGEALAAVVTLAGQTDTLTHLAVPLHQARTGDAGQVLLGGTYLPFEVHQAWDSAAWHGPVWRAVEAGRFPDSLWLAGRFGGSDALRLSRGSGCWCTAIDSSAAAPVASGEVLRIGWKQWAWGGTDDRPSLEIEVRWGDEDQLLPAFWRAVERWGTGVQWRLVCPAREAFGVAGLPAWGLPPHVPVVFEAAVSR